MIWKPKRYTHSIRQFSHENWHATWGWHPANCTVDEIHLWLLLLFGGVRLQRVTATGKPNIEWEPANVYGTRSDLCTCGDTGWKRFAECAKHDSQSAFVRNDTRYYIWCVTAHRSLFDFYYAIHFRLNCLGIYWRKKREWRRKCFMHTIAWVCEPLRSQRHGRQQKHIARARPKMDRSNLVAVTIERTVTQIFIQRRQLSRRHRNSKELSVWPRLLSEARNTESTDHVDITTQPCIYEHMVFPMRCHRQMNGTRCAPGKRTIDTFSQRTPTMCVVRGFGSPNLSNVWI